MPKDRTANSGSPEKSRWYDSIDYHLAWARMPALLRRIRPTGILSAFQCELRADKVQEAVRQLPRPLSDESHQALLRSRYPAFFDCASKVTVQICHSLSSRVLPSTQELVSTALNPGLLLIFDRESDELVVDSAGLHYLNQIAERDGAKFQHWLTRMRSSKGSQLAAVLEREIQCWLAEEVCSAFPFEQHVGRIDSQLGLTLRRCEEEGSEPLVST